MKKKEYIVPVLGWRAIGAGLFCASMGRASTDDDFESLGTMDDSGSWDAGW